MELLVVGTFLLVGIVFLISLWTRDNRPPQSPVYIPEGSGTTQHSARRTIAPASPKNAALSLLLPEEFIVLDLETTGLSPYKDEIIEFGAIRASLNSNAHPTFQTLVKPEKRIPKRITEITGITQGMVDKEGLPLIDALTQFVQFIGNLPLVTFNAAFDMRFIYSAAAKHGFVINNRYTCALKRARRAWPGLPSYRLVDLAKMGSLSDEEMHRALCDCKRTVIIFTSATATLGQKVRWSKPTYERVIGTQSRMSKVQPAVEQAGVLAGHESKDIVPLHTGA